MKGDTIHACHLAFVFTTPFVAGVFNLVFVLVLFLQEGNTEESDDSSDTASIAEEQWRGCDKIGNVVESVKKQPNAIV